MKQPPAPRLREPNRTNKLPWVTLDEILPDDHEARTVWKYVSALDMSPFLVEIRAVEGVPGRDATDPRLLLALWMFATVDGIGSARWLEELCVDHTAYRWLCGGVSVNYHMLADFRRDYTEQLESTLKAHVSSLMQQGLITLNRVAQDGMRVRAHAGSGSFRRSQTIEEYQQQVAEQLALLLTAA